MKTQTYTVTPGTNINEAIERAIAIAHAINKPVIVVMNGARFCVNPDTTVQKAIDTYLEVKDQMFETEKLLQQQKVK